MYGSGQNRKIFKMPEERKSEGMNEEVKEVAAFAIAIVLKYLLSVIGL